jgi:V8-like Glu-specific endopeptidase
MAQKRRAARGAAAKPPLGPDEYLALDNARAERKMPAKLATQMETPRVSIHMPDKARDLRRAIKPARSAKDVEIELPVGSALAVPGSSLLRSTSSAVSRGIRRTLSARKRSEPFKPSWSDFTPHPKVTTASVPLMRRAGGGLLEPEKVYGSDGRQVYYPSGYPWTCVGKVLVWNDFSMPFPSWSGSGVLIGDRVVLTAGHVVPWGSTNWAMRFVPAFYDGGSTLGSAVSSWVSDAHGYNTGNNVSAWDMAVLRLYTPLGQAYGYFGTKNYSSSWEGGNYWTLAGYPGAISSGNRPSRQMWWPVIDDDSDGSAEEVEHRADSSGGNSGGPVFGFWSGMPYAIATHSGHSKTTFLGITLEDNNVGAGGGALNSLVAWARSNWP